MPVILIPLHATSYTNYISLVPKLGVYSCKGVNEWENINPSVHAPNTTVCSNLLLRSVRVAASQSNEPQHAPSVHIVATCQSSERQRNLVVAGGPLLVQHQAIISVRMLANVLRPLKSGRRWSKRGLLAAVPRKHHYVTRSAHPAYQQLFPKYVVKRSPCLLQDRCRR